MIVLSSRNLLLFPLTICCGLLCCTLIGCGTGDYEKSIKASEKIISNRDKFSILNKEPVLFSKNPVSFRLPKLFIKENDPNAQTPSSFNWNGFVFTPKSKDPYSFAGNKNALKDPNTEEVKTQFQNNREPIFLPLELQSSNSDRGYLGTILCEGFVPKIPETQDEAKENAKRNRWYLVQLICWSFSSNAEAKVGEAALLSKFKSTGRTKPFTLQPPPPEDVALLGPTDNQPSVIEFAAVDFKGSFVSGRTTPQDQNSSLERKGTPDDGTLYLGKALIKNYTFFVALRVPKALSEESEFTPDKMKNMVLAMLGSVTLDADTLAEVAEKGKSKSGK